MQTSTPTKSSQLIEATPFFYGWVILAAGTASIIMMGPTQTFTIGIFIDFFIHDFGISRATVSLIYGLATLGGSLLLPVTGRWVDRYGPRRMIVVVGFCLGAAAMAMPWVQGSLTLFIVLLALRFLGFGSLQLVCNNVIAQWFIRKRGLVMGIAGQSLAINLIIFPLMAQYFIEQFGWHGAWVIFGLLVWSVVLPVGGFFFKDAPEQYGLLPDGDSQLQVKAGQTQISERNWTLAEARRTGIFWLFAGALSVIALSMAGLVFHQVSLFESRGLSQNLAVTTFTVQAIFSVAGNLGMGRLLDKYSARRLLALLLLTLAAALILVQMMATPVEAFVYGALVGLVSGSFRVMDSVVWAKYFGRRYLGSIKGVTMIMVVGATAFGPYPLGLSLDYFGSYSPALMSLLPLPVVIGLAALLINRPERKRRER